MKYLLIVSASILLATCGLAQNNQTPSAVTSSFNAKFPNAQKVKWDKENAEEWEAEFKLNGSEYSANFKADGSWLETEHKIKKSSIPGPVKAAVDKEFPGFKIDEAEFIETPEGTFYEFEIEKGKQEKEVLFDSNGKLLKSHDEEESDDEEKDDN